MARKRIAVITARADDAEQKATLLGIAETAFSMNADIAVFSNIYNHWIKDELLNFENHIYDYFQPEHFDGIIVTAEPFMELSILAHVLEKIRTAGIPAVVIDGVIPGFISVVSDDESDMQQITEHLLTVHGMTKIDILTGFADQPISHTRVAGCRKAFAAHGIPFDESHVHYGNFWNDSGEQLAQRYLSGELPMPEAVICTNDYMAYGLCDTLTAAGISIPSQITVTGYDYSEGRIYHYPLLTTYRRNRRQTGARAVSILFSGEIVPSAGEDRFVCGNTCTCGVDSVQLSEEIHHARIGQYHTIMNSVAQFTSRLTLCRTLAEYTAVLREFRYLLHGASQLCLCLEKAWNNVDYSGETLLCCTVSEATLPDEAAEFPRNLLLPALWEEREAPMLFYFSPLCFQQRMFGYTVLSYDSPQCYDFSFRDWNKTVANALEFLRMKNDIHYLKQCQRISSLYDALTDFYHMREFCQMTETAGSAGSGAYLLLAVKLGFPSDGEYLYGENYRSDIISAAANAIRQAVSPREICCRAAEDLFLILAKKENGDRLSDKLKVFLHHAVYGKYDEEQVILTPVLHTDAVSAAGMDMLCHNAVQAADEMLARQIQRQSHPHYHTLLALRNRVRREPRKAPSTEEVCRMLCISDGYFRVTYKKCFGVSYVQDCIHARIMLARYLLCITAMSVYAVALQCGYSDEKYFTRQFRQNTGCSPMQFREQHC